LNVDGASKKCGTTFGSIGTSLMEMMGAYTEVEDEGERERLDTRIGRGE